MYLLKVIIIIKMDLINNISIIYILFILILLDNILYGYDIVFMEYIFKQ